MADVANHARLRITIVLASGFGLAGGERMVANWAKHLQQRGHRILLISPRKPPPTWRARLRQWRKGTFRVPRKTSHFDAVDVPRVLLEKSRPVSDGDIPDADVVMATWWETAEWVAALSPRKGAKAHLIQQHEIFDYMPKARVAATYTLPLHKIVSAEWLEKVMREQYADPCVSRISVAVDRALFDAPPRAKQKVPTVGLMYSPLYWKGCDVSLHAFALARQQLPSLRLVVFGVEPPTPKLPLPRDASFIYQPPQNLLREIYAQCDAWLFGSRSEGFALPPMEAMACHTPVIGTPAGGEAQLIANGGGILVPPEDAEAMARAILEVAAMSDAEWWALSDAAYQTIAPYTWEHSTDDLENALHVAIERTARGELAPKKRV